jgi:AcrR family transcriptional regulator
VSRRAQLMRAAAGILADRPFAEVRVDDIVEAAGLAHGTFYLYFHDKNELLLALAEGARDTFVPMVMALPDIVHSADPDAACRAWMADYLAAFQSWAPVVRAWEQATALDQTLAELGAQIRDRLASNLSMLTGDSPIPTIALIALLDRFPVMALSQRFNHEPERVAETLHVLLLRGFTPQSQLA